MGFNSEEIADFSKEKYKLFSSYQLIGSITRVKQISVDSPIDDIYDKGLNRKKSGIYSFKPQPGAGVIGGGPNKIYYANDSTKEMRTTVTYIKADDLYKVFIKQDIYWDEPPRFRYSDIVAVKYTDDFRLDELNQLPNIEFNMSYKEDYLYQLGAIWDYNLEEKTTQYNIKYTGADRDKYAYNIGDYVGFRFDLPDDQHIDGSSNTFVSLLKYSYYDFKISMESTFVTKSTTTKGMEMASYYVHQTGMGTFDWGQLSFTYLPPYVSYSTSLFKNDPTFESALYSSMSMTFEE